MGAAFSTELSAADGEDVPHYASWRIPSWPGAKAQGPAVVAGRDLEMGEVIERSYCLELQRDELMQSYLGDFCVNVPPALIPQGERGPAPDGPAAKSVAAGAAVRLFPFSWGLILLSGEDNQAVKPNLRSELVWEPPPMPPAPAPQPSGPVPNRAWLYFTAARRILKGEPLRATLPAGLYQKRYGSVFEAARREYHMDDWYHQPESDDEEPGCLNRSVELEEVPVVAILPEDPVAVVAASALHGVGMFAARDLRAGDFLELTPSVPVDDKHVDGDHVVNDYTFESEFASDRDISGISHLMLGGGCIYNHSESQNVADEQFPDSPFVRKWHALESIPQGTELLSSYGDDYWGTRGLKPKGSRQRFGRRACMGGSDDE
eukprot:TRINITY_DN18329_c0_g1_i1.p1 TRINITY_DN18329_c0_g1~~TRINITY_DN18329_c0_g1_i1.p1  ORF type:complete len:407 (-),score=56.35 TRINITY_DN18329_c0_g1_i1:85-1212(-)